MNYQIKFMSISIKDLPVNSKNNFLTTLQKLQTTTPLLAKKEDQVKCESKYLKGLKKMQNNPLVKEPRPRK